GSRAGLSATRQDPYTPKRPRYGSRIVRLEVRARLGRPGRGSSPRALTPKEDPMTRQADPEQRAVLAAVDAAAAPALALAQWMADHPELSLEERATSERYRAHPAELGFAVEAGVAGMPTAFVARRGGSRAPVCAALLAEMDALPEIGHACGHNLSGPASLLAAQALAAAVPEAALRLLVVGCPAEEIGVGNRPLLPARLFPDAPLPPMAP